MHIYILHNLYSTEKHTLFNQERSISLLHNINVSNVGTRCGEMSLNYELYMKINVLPVPYWLVNVILCPGNAIWRAKCYLSVIWVLPAISGTSITMDYLLMKLFLFFKLDQNSDHYVFIQIYRWKTYSFLYKAYNLIKILDTQKHQEIRENVNHVTV